MSPADTTQKMLGGSMGSLLTALLCALSENTGHPSGSLSGSAQEGAQLLSNSVVDQQWYKFDAE